MWSLFLARLSCTSVGGSQSQPPKGPYTAHLMTLVPKTILGIVSSKTFNWAVHGPFGSLENRRSSMPWAPQPGRPQAPTLTPGWLKFHEAPGGPLELSCLGALEGSQYKKKDVYMTMLDLSLKNIEGPLCGRRSKFDLKVNAKCTVAGLTPISSSPLVDSFVVCVCACRPSGFITTSDFKFNSNFNSSALMPC